MPSETKALKRTRSKDRNAAIDYMETHRNWTINELPGAKDAVVRGRLAAYMRELELKGLVEQTGEKRGKGNPQVYRLVDAARPPKPTPPQDAVTDAEMGSAIYDYITSLKTKIAQMENRDREHLEYRKQLTTTHRIAIAAKNDEIDNLKDRIVVLERQTSTRPTVVRAINRREIGLNAVS